MQQRPRSIRLITGVGLLALGAGWLSWICFLGVALRDGLDHGESGTGWALIPAFLGQAWPLLPDVGVAVLGWLVLRRARRR